MWLAATNGFLLALKGRGDAPGFSSLCCDPWASRNQPPRLARSRPDQYLVRLCSSTRRPSFHGWHRHRYTPLPPTTLTALRASLNRRLG